MFKHSSIIAFIIAGAFLLGLPGGPLTCSPLSARASQTPDNYLSTVAPGGKIIHFSPQSMPIKVYIANGYNVPGWHRDMRQAVITAMRTWQTASQGRISFTQTSDPAEGDIIVQWHKKFKDGILGLSPLETIGSTLVRSDVDLAVDYPDSDKPISLEDLTGIATHEMGHAIGLRGHSTNPNDLMFYSKTTDRNSLSQRDINTIRLLYGQDATIQNNVSTSTSQTRLYYQWYQAGLKAQNDKHTAEAIADYRQAIQLNGQLPEAKFNLGAILINTGNQIAKQGDWVGARLYFAEASRLYSDIARLPQAPSGTRENLAIAQSNWSLLNTAISRRQQH